VIQELPERYGAAIGVSLTVTEPVDDVPGKVPPGRIVEPAALLGVTMSALGFLASSLIIFVF
jgi:hypothetical protein